MIVGAPFFSEQLSSLLYNEIQLNFVQKDSDYAGMQVYRYAGMQVCMYASMHVCMYAGMQVCMYASMHVCR